MLPKTNPGRGAGEIDVLNNIIPPTVLGRNITVHQLTHCPAAEIGKPYSTCCTSGGKFVIWPDTTRQPLGVLT